MWIVGDGERRGQAVERWYACGATDAAVGELRGVARGQRPRAEPRARRDEVRRDEAAEPARSNSEKSSNAS